MNKNKVYLLLGSNLGNRVFFLNRAIERLTESVGDLITKSSVYETQSWGYDDQPYYNQVVEIATELQPLTLLNLIHIIETDLGRKRTSNFYQARTIDIDILFYDVEVINTTDLIVPHRFLHLRKFVLIPLSEIAGNFVHPIFNKTINQLLEDCEDNLEVTKIGFSASEN